MKKQQVYKKGNIVGVFYPELQKSVEVDLTKLSEPMKFCGLQHGIGQKLGDAASGKTAQEKFDEASAIRDALMQGIWERTASPDMTPLVIEALNRIDPKKFPKGKLEKAAAAKPEAVKEWRANAKVKAEIAKILAERAAARAEEADEEEVEIEL